MKAIEVVKLKKNYGETKALDEITFDLKKGEILAFLGPNGAGKTTTMKIITTYLHPTYGNVKVNGLNIMNEPVKIKKMIGYLPESTPLYTDMIVYDFLFFVGNIHNIPKSKLLKRIIDIADICDINNVINKRIRQLSKGYRQRVGLAYAMIHDPDILILDEPTSGLDPNQIIEIRKLIKELGKEKSIILSTHILSEAEATTNRVIIINKGKIVADGTVDSIRKENKHDIKINIKMKKSNVNINEVKEKISNIKSIQTVEDEDISAHHEDNVSFEISSKVDDNIWNEIYTLCKDENYPIYEIKEKELKLEDVFIKLTN